MDKTKKARFLDIMIETCEIIRTEERCEKMRCLYRDQMSMDVHIFQAMNKYAIYLPLGLNTRMDEDTLNRLLDIYEKTEDPNGVKSNITEYFRKGFRRIASDEAEYS